MFKLVIQDDEGKTTVVPLIRDEITIGRKEGNTIRLTERNVSRRHARILRNNGEVHIEDLGSYNGIRVNNARIAERVSLRVSDQVQIGDYKLYLKAEGLEQGADASQTGQVERSDSQVPTAVQPAITAPQPVQAVPAAPVATPVTNPPARPIIDTDPAGRPIVSAASVSGMNDGYGKLVVLSSNFAGKEFELSRPQMIVGRTDENDIVINHRSISRNHAKLVREPDTGRYTISDLQSSNGVRVNGQDYGKVELRRGDVVDLGHVRLRFVEAGEDFVFERDAVITDVPEAGGKRGVLFAMLAAIVVLGAGVAIYMTMRPENSQLDIVAPGGGTNSGIAIDAGEAAVAQVAVPERPTEAADAAAATTPGTTVKAPEDDTNPKGQCVDYKTARDWQGLTDCARGLEKTDKAKAKEYLDFARRELKNELSVKDVQQLLRQKNLRGAEAALNKIDAESVYAASTREAFTKAETAALEPINRRALGYVNAHDCASLRTLARQLSTSSTQRIAGAVAALRCVEKAAPEPVARPNPAQAGSAATSPGATASAGTTPGTDAAAVPTATTPAAGAAAAGGACAVNVDEVMKNASTQYSSGFFKAALSQVQKALACKQTTQMYRMGAMYACAARDLQSAKLYFAKLSPQFQSAIIQRCQQEGLEIRPQ